MDVFRVRDRLIEDYREFTGSFVDILDERIRAHVGERTRQGYQWPEPWLALNPGFAPGGTITDLVRDGILQPECEQIFRLKGQDTDGQVLRLHRHQREAIEAARTKDSYVLTTGTGSGKSLAYLIPIVDRVLATKAAGTYQPGIKAIVVYPMNALANSQLRELRKFLALGFPDGPLVSFERYTGQEGAADRERIIASPPDILLTNYVMLELVLTRPRERDLVEAARGLWFLVLDELHSYRGRQGADVALLVRRVREACQAPQVQCVGTSATMTTQGDAEAQRRAAAEVASTLFGVQVQPGQVIGETLERVTSPAVTAPESLRHRVADPAVPATFGELIADPLASWIEDTFGIEPGSPPGSLARRRRPLTLSQAAGQLAELTGLPPGGCTEAIKRMLQAGSRIRNPATGRPVFAFRLHQFLSKGDNVYVTIEPSGTRHVTSTYQVAAPAAQAATPAGPDSERILVPVAFCRECGQDYLVVTRCEGDTGRVYAPRQDRDAAGGDEATGYLYISDDYPWPESVVEALTDGRLPYSWLTYDEEAGQAVDPARVKYLPEPVHVDVTGRETGPDEGTRAAYVPSPFRFCLRCRTSYEQARGSDFAKLAKLSAEGRSSAMSLITASIVRTLGGEAAELGDAERKLLAFVDNRQDASLQAGHFNDFDERTVICGVLPRAATGDTLLIAFTTGNTPLLQANLSAFVLDYSARQKATGTHMKYFVFKQLPVLPPRAYEEPVAWLEGAAPAGWVRDRVLELSYTAWDMAPFARDLGDEGPPFRWDEQRRTLIRAELDAAYFHLYGLDRDEVEHAMDCFDALRRREQRELGEYCTKRLILGRYDALAAAARTGTGYRSLLAPPPGHGPRHPDRPARRQAG